MEYNQSTRDLPEWNETNKSWLNETVPPFSTYDYQRDRQIITTFQFYLWGVIGSIIATLGLIGNVLSIVVLCHRRMRSSTSTYLTALSIYDCFVLLTMLLVFSLLSIQQHTRSLPVMFEVIFAYTQPYAYPLALIAQTCSIYTTVGFTVERYIAVCLPLTAAKMCTQSRAKKSVLLIFVASVLYNIPRTMEYHTVLEQNLNSTIPRFQPTAFQSNHLYQQIYLLFMHLLVMLVVPFTILTVLNVLLIKAVNESASTQGRITSRQRHENNLTVMLLSVVITFLVCQILSIVDNVCSAVNSAEQSNTPKFTLISTIACLMVILNSAVNFYLYCVFGRKFRQVFCLIFFRCRPQHHGKHSIHSHTQLTGSIYHKNNASVKRSNPLPVNENGNHVDKYAYKRLDVPNNATKETVM